ncbi:MAG: DNA-3-methyladenine glycosylase 2 family protein [Chloroflexota bacterium]
MTDLELVPRGPFSLAAAMDFAGGFPAGIGGGGVGVASITLAFPVEGTDESAAIELWQDADGVVRGRTDATGGLADAALRQAARSLSLDHDGSGWPAVGDRDPVIGELQRAHRFLRPVCFYSAYEAATSFVIGQRISRRQSAVIKRDLAERLGDRPTIAGQPQPAFPRPARLLELREAKGLNDEKIRRLHGLAEAAIDGRLDTDRLRSMDPADALASLLELPGVGPFTANGVLYRGCGLADGIPNADAVGLDAVRDLYGVEAPTPDDVLRLGEAWRPYRMWAVVLVRVGWSARSSEPVSYRRS